MKVVTPSADSVIESLKNPLCVLASLGFISCLLPQSLDKCSPTILHIGTLWFYFGSPPAPSAIFMYPQPPLSLKLATFWYFLRRNACKCILAPFCVISSLLLPFLTQALSISAKFSTFCYFLRRKVIYSRADSLDVKQSVVKRAKVLRSSKPWSPANNIAYWAPFGLCWGGAAIPPIFKSRILVVV